MERDVQTNRIPTRPSSSKTVSAANGMFSCWFSAVDCRSSITREEWRRSFRLRWVVGIASCVVERCFHLNRMNTNRQAIHGRHSLTEKPVEPDHTVMGV